MKTNKSFSFFPEFDKEANNKLVSSIFKSSRENVVGNPMDLLIWASKYIKKDGKV